jgi:hypothetical protein
MSTCPRKVSPHIGTLGQTGTLGDLIHGPLPIPLDLFQSLQRGPGFDDLGGDVLLNLMLDHSESLRRRGQTGTRRACTHKQASVDRCEECLPYPNSGRAAIPLKESAKCQ